MLYTDAFKGTAYLYVGEGFSGGEDVLFAVMEASPPPFSYNVDPQRQHANTHTHTQVLMCNCRSENPTFHAI